LRKFTDITWYPIRLTKSIFLRLKWILNDAEKFMGKKYFLESELSLATFGKVLIFVKFAPGTLVSGKQ
jgi:hypothetical protein